MSIRVGSIGYDCASGLAHLVHDFYRHGVVNSVLVVPHSHYPRYPDRYPPEAKFTKRRERDSGNIEEFLRSIDILLLFENPFYQDVVDTAKKHGIKSVLIPNYEYTPFPPKVDFVLCGSLLDVDYYKDILPTTFLPIPVEQEWRLRERALTFLHNAGHGQWHFAKGTPIVAEAMEYVKSPIKMRITGQPGEKRISELFLKYKDHPKIELVYGDLPRRKLFDADVFVFPEAYNGMSLPLQEAYASGMLVMATDRYPANTWLPKEPLLPVSRVEKRRICVEFDWSVVDPQAVAAKIDEYYNTDISAFSLRGKEWAEQTSWEVLRPKYLEVLEQVRDS